MDGAAAAGEAVCVRSVLQPQRSALVWRAVRQQLPAVELLHGYSLPLAHTPQRRPRIG